MKFIEGKIIDKFIAGKNIEVILRYPRMSDAKQLMKFYNKVIKETDFLSRIKLVTISEETKWLKEMMEGMKNNNAILLIVVADGRIRGTTTIIRNREHAMHHVGLFGIAILQEFTGMGIGSKLTQKILNLAKTYMKLEIVKSNCFSENKASLKLHKKFGFKVIGKIPDGFKKKKENKNRYWDEILLYKKL